MNRPSRALRAPNGPGRSRAVAFSIRPPATLTSSESTRLTPRLRKTDARSPWNGRSPNVPSSIRMVPRPGSPSQNGAGPARGKRSGVRRKSSTRH